MQVDRPYRRGRLMATIACALATVTAFIAILAVVTVRCWVGTRELRVCVQINDAETMMPLSDAVVTAFDGPPTPFGGAPRAPRPDPKSATTQEMTTDRTGRAEFARRFRATGTDGVFTHSGFILLTGTWIRVTPIGYETVLVPVDGQSMRARDIDDKSPVFVTLLLRKAAVKQLPSAQRASDH
jgi:hypothetical protein